MREREIVASRSVATRVLPAVRVAGDRYDDNEDKWGAKFLVGISDRARYRSSRVNRMCGGAVAAAVKLPPTSTETSW